MDYNIKTLLEKYWEGQSSLEEEKILRDYFQQEDIVPEFEQYRGLFNYFTVQKTIAMSKEIAPKNLNKKTAHRLAKKRRLPLLKVAAAAVLLVGLFSIYNIFYNNKNTIQQKAIVWEDTYDNEEDALRKAKEVLLLVSRKMKKGTDKAALSLDKVELATGVVKD